MQRDLSVSPGGYKDSKQTALTTENNIWVTVLKVPLEGDNAWSYLVLKGS